MLRPDSQDVLTDRIGRCLHRLDGLLAAVADGGEDSTDAAQELASGTDELRSLVDALLRSSDGRGAPATDPRRP